MSEAAAEAADGRQQPADSNVVRDDSIASDHNLSTALLDIIWLMNGNWGWDSATPRRGNIFRRIIIGVACEQPEYKLMSCEVQPVA